jgi:hypothetical protein
VKTSMIEQQLRCTDERLQNILDRHPLGISGIAKAVHPYLRNESRCDFGYLGQGRSALVFFAARPAQYRRVSLVFKIGKRTRIQNEAALYDRHVTEQLVRVNARFPGGPYPASRGFSCLAYTWTGEFSSLETLRAAFIPKPLTALKDALAQLADILFPWYGINRKGLEPFPKWDWSRERTEAVLSNRQIFGGSDELIREFLIGNLVDQWRDALTNLRFASGRCHGDFHSENIVVSSSSRNGILFVVPHLVDFANIREDRCPASDWSKLELDLKTRCLRDCDANDDIYLEQLRMLNAHLSGRAAGRMDPYTQKAWSLVTQVRSSYVDHLKNLSGLAEIEYLYSLTRWSLYRLSMSLKNPEGIPPQAFAESAQTALRELVESVEIFRTSAELNTRFRYPEHAPDDAGLKTRFPAPLNQAVPSTPPLSSVSGEAPIWYVPFARNPKLRGRDDVLLELHASSQAKSNSRIVQALVGLPGLGKTSIAAEYAHRFRSEYSLIWWLRSTDGASLTDDYKSLAVRILGASVVGTFSITDYLSGFLSKFSNWLLIFDGATWSDTFTAFLPKTGIGHVLVTTREQPPKEVATTFQIQPLRIPDAAAFLLDCAGQLTPSAADQLAKELDGVPAALDKAVCYLQLTGDRGDRYLERIRRLKNRSFIWHESDDSSDLAVAATWMLTIQKAKIECPAARNVLSFMEWWEDDAVPLDFIRIVETLPTIEKASPLRRAYAFLIVKLLEWITGPRSTASRSTTALQKLHDFPEAVRVLRKYSLVSVSSDRIRLLPLVKVLTRTRHPKFARPILCRKSMTIALMAAQCALDTRDWDSSALWLRHARSAVGHCAAIGIREKVVEDARDKIEHMSALLKVLKEYDNRVRPGDRMPHGYDDLALPG